MSNTPSLLYRCEDVNPNRGDGAVEARRQGQLNKRQHSKLGQDELLPDWKVQYAPQVPSLSELLCCVDISQSLDQNAQHIQSNPTQASEFFLQSCTTARRRPSRHAQFCRRLARDMTAARRWTKGPLRKSRTALVRVGRRCSYRSRVLVSPARTPSISLL